MTKAVFFERELNGQMKDFCRISNPGVRDIWEGPARPEDLQRFPTQWQEYLKNKKKKKVKGTHLSELPGMTEPRRTELELAGIESCEELDVAEETKLRNLGDAYIELQRIAQLYMKAKPKKTNEKPIKLTVVEKNEPSDDNTERS
tara:strand:+ start:3640 stop:4074 length:435 start_codon:yes stop_codon:yes gene_type:complete